MTEHTNLVQSLVFDFPLDPDVMHRLETDARMKEAVTILRRHVSTDDQVREVLRRAAAAKTKAELNRKSTSWPKGWQSRANKALGAVDALTEFLRPYAQAAPENSAIYERFHEIGDSLFWAKGFINEELAAKQRQLKRGMPASRKKDDSTLAFCKILCGDLFELVGQPLCAFVGIVVAVAFGVPGRIDEKNVESAWKNEKDKKHPQPKRDAPNHRTGSEATRDSTN